MERTEIRAIIKWYHLKGKTVTKIKSKLDAVLGDKSPAMGTIHKWVSEFKNGRVGCEDESRSGRPIDVTTPQVIAEIVRIVTNDRSINVRDLGNSVNASYGRVHNILLQNLKIRKVSGEWTALELTAEQKQKRIEVSTQCLDIQQRDPQQFEQRFLSICASWIRPKYVSNVDPNGGPVAKVPRMSTNTQPTTTRNCVLVTIGCDAGMLLSIDFRGFDEVDEILSEHYVKFVESMRERLQAKQGSGGSSTEQSLLLQLGSAGLLETSEDFVEQLRDFRIELLPHVTDSPDLTMSTCHIFPNLRKWLEGRKFSNEEAFKSAVLEYYASLGPGHYQDGIAKLEAHWRKCIELNGEYVSK